MPPELQYHEGEPGAYDAHRMMAQLYLMELLGVGSGPEEMIAWIEDGKNGKKFADLIEGDSELVAKLAERNLSVEEISALRDDFLFDKIDTGAEDHGSEREPDA